MGLFFCYILAGSIKSHQMKFQFFLISAGILLLLSCSNAITYSPEHIKQTSGRYVFNQNEVIDVYYRDNELFVTWKGGEQTPVVLDNNTFFVPDMYQKLRFVVHPETKKRYLGVVDEEDESKVTYEYPKVADDYKTPWMHLNSGEYGQATNGYFELRKQDSTKTYIEETEVNRMGYNLLGERKYADAIAVFKMNVALYPESDNVYDSLADAYLRSGDSLQAYTNYKKAHELNTGNKRAKEYIAKYEKRRE